MCVFEFISEVCYAEEQSHSIQFKTQMYLEIDKDSLSTHWPDN